MRFVCTQDNLLAGLARVSPLAGRNPQLPILQHLLIEVRDGVLYMTGTDLEVGARVVVAGKAEEEGSCTVPARQFYGYIQQLPSDHPLTVEVVKKRLVVTTRGFTAQFLTSEAEEFPLLPGVPARRTALLDGRLLCRALSRVVFAAAHDESRPEIHSIYVGAEGGEMRLAATDSFRLAEQVLPLKASLLFLLPVAAAQEVSRLFAETEALDLFREENYVVWQGESMYLTSRLIDGQYPNYQQIIPTTFAAQGTVEREELLRGLKILSVFLPRESRRVALAVRPRGGTLELRVEGSEAGHGEVELAFTGSGADLDVLFNVHYLMEGVAHLTGEHVQLGFGGKNDPLAVRPAQGAERYLYVVMPIQA